MTDYLAIKFQSGEGQQPSPPTWNVMNGRYEFHVPRQGILCVEGALFDEAVEHAKKDHPVSNPQTAWALSRALNKVQDWKTWDARVDDERVYYLEGE